MEIKKNQITDNLFAVNIILKGSEYKGKHRPYILHNMDADIVSISVYNVFCQTDIEVCGKRPKDAFYIDLGYDVNDETVIEMRLLFTQSFKATINIFSNFEKYAN